MNIDILHRPTALENLFAYLRAGWETLAGRIWHAGRRLPLHGLEANQWQYCDDVTDHSIKSHFSILSALPYPLHQLVNIRQLPVTRDSLTFFKVCIKKDLALQNEQTFLARASTKMAKRERSWQGDFSHFVESKRDSFVLAGRWISELNRPLLETSCIAFANITITTLSIAGWT